MAERQEGYSPESQETKEKEPTLEEWANVYAEMEEIEDSTKILEVFESLQTEMSEEERRDLTMPVYVKEGTTVAKAWEMIKKENPVHEYIDPEMIFTLDFDKRALVAFAHFSQEPDKDTVEEKQKVPAEWEETGQKYMSPKTAMIAREAFRRLTGKQMDEKYWTMCPESRTEHNGVVLLYFHLNEQKVHLNEISDLYNHNPHVGVRRVVSREIKPES